MNKDLLLSSYDYSLPEQFIAQVPAIPAHNAKLMICTQSWKSYTKEHAHFSDLPNLLTPDHILFLNRTKVFKARIPLKNTKILRKSWKEILLKEGEIFVYSIHSLTQFECLVSDSKNFKPWSNIFFGNWIILKSTCFTEDGILFEIHWIPSIFEFLEQIWEMPLPPYITYKKEKEARYQTFFAEEIWSAAAPTASLHFTPELVKKLEENGINFQYLCLHVGLWTFKPIYEEHIQNQKLHTEPLIIPKDIWEIIMKAKKEKKIFLPVWTTMIRYLESLPYIRKFFRNEKNKNITFSLFSSLTEETITWWDKLTSSLPEKRINEFIPKQKIEINNKQEIKLATRLFIRPWIPFLLTDELITNFHLPKSSLIMLIAAFMWREEILMSYELAKEKEYKFYSFWDGMWVKGKINYPLI